MKIIDFKKIKDNNSAPLSTAKLSVILSNEKMRPLRFILWGALNTLIAYFLYLILFSVFKENLVLTVAYMGSYTLSFILTVLLGYFLHCRFTFYVRPWNFQQFFAFCSLYVSTALLNFILLPILVEIINLSPELAQGLLFLIIPWLSYVGQKKFVFKI